MTDEQYDPYTDPDLQQDGHDCSVPACDGSPLGHRLAMDFPAETAACDDALDRLRSCGTCGRRGIDAARPAGVLLCPACGGSA